MHAYLIISKDKVMAREKAEKITSSQLGKLIPFQLKKISDVHELQDTTKLSAREPIFFFIEDIHEASIDALNSFLKHLEEPGRNVFYILTSKSEDKVLPTIVSRCQVIRLQAKDGDVKLSHPMSIVEKFWGKSIGRQITEVDKIKKRDEAIAFLQNFIDELHQEMVNSEVHKLLPITSYLSHSQTALTALEKNGNVTIQLTRMVMEWNKLPCTKSAEYSRSQNKSKY